MSEVVITVRGEHEVRAAPEEGVVRISVRAEGHERGPVVERIASLADPIRSDLAARKEQGTLRDWSSQRVAVWANRPWNSEGKQLSLVHYASVEFIATFTDFAAMSWWVADLAERDGIQIDDVTWQLTPRDRAAGGGGCRGRRRPRRGRSRHRVRCRDRACDGDAARDRGCRTPQPQRVARRRPPRR